MLSDKVDDELLDRGIPLRKSAYSACLMPSPAGPQLKMVSTMSVGYGNIAIQFMHGDKEELTTWYLRARFAALAS